MPDTTPTASPTVSSTIGLKNVVIAPLTTDTESAHTYGALQLLAGAIEATVTPNNTDPDVQYADDNEFDVLYAGSNRCRNRKPEGAMGHR